MRSCREPTTDARTHTHGSETQQSDRQTETPEYDRVQKELSCTAAKSRESLPLTQRRQFKSSSSTGHKAGEGVETKRRSGK